MTRNQRRRAVRAARRLQAAPLVTLGVVFDYIECGRSVPRGDWVAWSESAPAPSGYDLRVAVGVVAAADLAAWRRRGGRCHGLCERRAGRWFVVAAGAEVRSRAALLPKGALPSRGVAYFSGGPVPRTPSATAYAFGYPVRVASGAVWGVPGQRLARWPAPPRPVPARVGA